MNDSQTVLVIECDKTFRVELASDLKRTGFAVEAYETVAELLETYRPTGRACVVMKLGQDVKAVLAMRRVIRQNHWFLPVICLATDGALADVIRLMEEGVHVIADGGPDRSELTARLRQSMLNIASEQSRWNRRSEALSMLSTLTAREREVMRLVLGGETTRQIADALCISPRTVEVHRTHIKRKLHTRSITDLFVLGTISGDFDKQVNLINGHIPFADAG